MDSLGALDLERANSARQNTLKSDSLVSDNSLTRNKSNPASPIDGEANSNEDARLKTAQNKTAIENAQRILNRQDRLYREYADQSAQLARDIDRLNRRLETNRRQSRNNYYPVPIPYNNSQNSNKPVASVPIKVTDTVYVRDTIYSLHSDTLKKVISLSAMKQDAVDNQVRDTIKISDTVVIKNPAKQMSFDYTTMPEIIVLFGIGKSDVLPVYDSQLNFVAGILKKNPLLHALISGHTDSSGSKAINQKLSLERAQAVAGYLVNKGISQDQMILESFSSKDPAVTGAGKTARSQNRRVVLKLLEK